MVNRPLPGKVAKCLPRAWNTSGLRARRRLCPAKLRLWRLRPAFAQFLAKSYFFQLPENLRCILLDYGQNLIERANVAFKAAC
jgi:hypothetical protein